MLEEEPTHLQTRPPDLALPFIPFHPSYSPGPSSLALKLAHSPLVLCPSVSALKTEARLRGRQGALYVELC